MDAVCSALFKGKTLPFQRCEDVDKNVSVFWTVKGSTLETLLIGKLTEGWVGLGWGYRAMDFSNSVIAYKDTLGVAQAGDYHAQYKDSAGVQPGNRQNLTLLEPHATVDSVSVLFVRPIASPGNGVPAINATGPNPLIWAYGPSSPSATNLKQHLAKDSIIVDFRAPGIRAAAIHPHGPFFQAHGLMMGIAWLVFVPIAVVLMRFFKKLNPVTFQIHRALNILAATVAFVAYVMGVSRGSHTQRAHLAIGTLVLLLALVQVFSGWVRPRKGSRVRKVWFLLHAYPGRIALCLAILNAYFGMFIYGLRWHWYVISSGIVVCFCTAVVLFSLSPSKFPVVDDERRDLNGDSDIEDEIDSDGR